MILQKWNWKKHKYEKYEVPDKYKCKLYSRDMEEMINCPHCGKELKYGDSFTSREIHNEMGFGYAVCESCYNEEWKRSQRESDN